jgi:HPt (histidine-containing phosphotransfer) domain-containing protein
MTEARDELKTLLAAAREEFALRLEDKVRELQELSDRGAWIEARRAAHKLRGSAGTYGFAKISAAAAVMEEVLIEAEPSPDEDARNRFAAALATARLELEAATREGP